MVKVVVSGMVMPKEEHTKLLDELVSKAEAKTLVADGKIKVALTGQLCSLPDKPLLDMIEDLGMVVADDDLYAGGRYFATDVETDGHPIEALADYQLNIPPCSTRQKPEYYSVTNPAPYYSEYVVDMINRSSAQGVIVLKVMYCDPYDMEYPVLSEKLSDKGIPNFTVITGYEMASLESIRTRLQAFVEMISQK